MDLRGQAVIYIIGLGPSGIDRLSVGAYRMLRDAPTVFVRTALHPAIEELTAEGMVFQALDYVYETADTFVEVYRRIARTIIDAAESGGEVVYAVPGHPLVGETAVRLLMTEAAERGIEYRVIGSESFVEPMLEALGIGFDIGLKIVDALSMDTVTADPNVGNFIYQVYDRDIASDVKLRLMDDYPDDFAITVVMDAGGGSPKVMRMPLYELDRHNWDHLTTVYVPPCAGD